MHSLVSDWYTTMADSVLIKPCILNHNGLQIVEFCRCFWWCMLNVMESVLVTADLSGLCKTLHDKVCFLEEEVYDWEVKIRKQDFEVSLRKLLN